jgi:hypothetical protein
MQPQPVTVTPPDPSHVRIFDDSTWVVQLWHGLGVLWPSIVIIFKNTLSILIAISIPLSVFFLIGIVYCVEMLKRIRHKEHEIYDLKVEPAYETVVAADNALANRWTSVQEHIESPNENDWRQAILEADIILDDILTKMGYRGESIGEKLKRADKADFKTLDDAWEAHMVRNRVAHDGSAYPLGQHEAKRVIHMYKKVFEEFYYI